MQSSVLAIGVGTRTWSNRRRLAFRVSEISIVSIFSLISLATMWLGASWMTQLIDSASVVNWFFPTGVGLFMFTIATVIWTYMLPGLVDFVRAEFKLLVQLCSRSTVKGAK